jgi:hypothetical protein
MFASDIVYSNRSSVFECDFDNLKEDESCNFSIIDSGNEKISLVQRERVSEELPYRYYVTDVTSISIKTTLN